MLYDIAVHPELDVDTAVHVPSLSQFSISSVAALVLITLSWLYLTALLCFHHSAITMNGNNNQRGRVLLPGESEQRESDICAQAGQDCKALGRKRLFCTMNDCLLALLTIVIKI